MNVDAVPYREQSALLTTEIQPFLLEDGVVEIIVEMNVCFGSSSAAIVIGGDDTVTSCGAVVIESSPQVPPLPSLQVSMLLTVAIEEYTALITED